MTALEIERVLKSVKEKADNMEKLILNSRGRYVNLEYHANGVPSLIAKVPFYAMIIRWFYRKGVAWPYERFKLYHEKHAKKVGG